MSYLLIPAGIVGYLIVGAAIVKVLDVVATLFWPYHLEWRQDRAEARRLAKAKLPRATARRQ
ncbi:MAG: hypothetical protein ACRCU1_01005 [Alsobacter sp.]